MPGETMDDLVLDWIDAEHGGSRHASKHLARLIGVSPRTTENWLARLNAPRLAHFGELMALYPALEARVHTYVEARRAANLALLARAEAAATDLRERLAHAAD